MKKENTASRLHYLMVKRNLRQVDILNACLPYCKQNNVKMNKSDISQYVSGKVEPNQDKLYILGKALNVTEAWLMGYDVPMEKITYADNSTPQILQYYDKLNDIGKHEATKRVEELTYFPQYTNATEVNAAHELPNSSLEDKIHDDDIMDDDSEWD